MAINKLLVTAILAILLTLTFIAPAAKWQPSKKSGSLESVLKDGDILFQSSVSRQCEAIRLATGSEWTHCGIVFQFNEEWMVIEAVQPVKWTPLDEFVNRGERNWVEVMRLRNAGEVLTPVVIAEMKARAQLWVGKNYDAYFNWSEDEIYCSELVWKIYYQCAHAEIGSLKVLGDYDLSSPVVKQVMAQRYGNDIPYDEPMISPGAIHDSELLLEIEHP